MGRTLGDILPLKVFLAIFQLAKNYLRLFLLGVKRKKDELSSTGLPKACKWGKPKNSSKNIFFHFRKFALYLLQTAALASICGMSSQVHAGNQDFAPTVNGNIWKYRVETYNRYTPSSHSYSIRTFKIFGSEQRGDTTDFKLEIQDSIYNRVIAGKNHPDTIEVRSRIISEHPDSSLRVNSSAMESWVFKSHFCADSLVSDTIVNSKSIRICRKFVVYTTICAVRASYLNGFGMSYYRNTCNTMDNSPDEIAYLIKFNDVEFSSAARIIRTKVSAPLSSNKIFDVLGRLNHKLRAW